MDQDTWRKKEPYVEYVTVIYIKNKTIVMNYFGGIILGLFSKLKEPVFLKENSNAEFQLNQLRELELKLNTEGQAMIRQDIKCLEYGIAGEKNIAFELKNSHMPMYILHDIYLEDEELSAQIDYLVFTKKMCFVIECKNLFGDIEINNTGDFIRAIEIGGKKKKEGIYSPITQNQRHLELMKKLKVEQKGNFFTKYMADKYFEEFNRSIVVLANPKTVLYAKYAKKEIKEKVIRADQLVAYIKEKYNQSKEAEDSEEKMLAWANFYLKLHKEVKKDYTSKYEPYFLKNDVNSIENSNIIYTKETVTNKNNKTESETENIEDLQIFLELKSYRLAKSREEKIKPYYIYNDAQLKDLISKMPRTKEELQKVSGFGPVKAEKYGNDILKILNK